MSNTVGYTIGCVTPVRWNLTLGEDVTGNGVGYAASTCVPGCWNGDYRDRRYWAQIPRSATAVTGGTDYYGALAPTLFYYGGGTYREICPTVCFCEGPVAEGATVTEYTSRYETRWMALLSEGLIYYGRKDGTLIQTPLDLFPDPLSETATHIAMAFDANARPVFAYEDDGIVHVRRYVAGVPTSYSWTGTEPCLFFNGVLEADDSLTDVVCYYLTGSGGGLYARLQRENFGVGNLVIENAALNSLQAVDRGRGVLASYMVIEMSGKRVFASVYQPWPVLVSDEATLSVALTGVGGYEPQVVLVSAEDTTSASVALSGYGRYEPQVWTLTEPEPANIRVSLTGAGDYSPQIVLDGSESDPIATSIALYGTGDYSVQIVVGGTYTEAATTAVSLYGTGTYELG